MDGNRLQNLIYYGYAQSALRLGLPCTQYRPAAVSAPLTTAYGSLLVSINAKDFKYAKANGYGSPVWYALADGRLMKVGDYLVGQVGTFYVASMQALLPIQVVECNRVVTVFRPQQQAGAGVVPYGGNTESNQTALITGWPCSILANAKADNGTVKLPGDTRSAWWNLLLPPLPFGLILKNDDVVQDDIGNRFVISSAELTDMGWRMTMAESET